MDPTTTDFLKVARAVASAAKAVEALEKAEARTPPDLVAAADAGDKAVSALGALPGFEALAAGVKVRAAARADHARTALERERALLAGKVAQSLSAHGIRVEGNLPTLHAGPYSLEFLFGTKAQCTIWFGPKKHRLASCPLEVEAIAAKVAELDQALFGPGFEDTAFLADLERAYRVTCFRLGLPDGERAPLSAVLGELAFQRQDAGFMNDPRRELFRTYGRTEFAADLGRLKTRRVGPRELRLDVATMTQTKHAEDHLWVPRGRTGDGVNYATLAFVRSAG